MSDWTLGDRALLRDLARRVSLVERHTYGHAAPQCKIDLLIRCYVAAHQALTNIDKTSAISWVAQSFLWDVRSLVAVGQRVEDPYPFRPLIAVVDRCVLYSAPDARAALQHLEDIARDVLDIQGLELVGVRETMGTLRLKEAIDRLVGA